MSSTRFASISKGITSSTAGHTERSFWNSFLMATIQARASLEGGNESFSGELDRLAIERTDIRLPAKMPLNRFTIATNVRFWAEVLRAVADEFLGSIDARKPPTS